MPAELCRYSTKCKKRLQALFLATLGFASKQYASVLSMFAWSMNRQATPFGSFYGLPLVGLGSMAMQTSIEAEKQPREH